jgi:pimeloyl-ACP methyl ester carboxylesterase
MTRAVGRPARRLSWGLVAVALVAGCRAPSTRTQAASCTHLQAIREVRGTSLCEDVWTCARPPWGRFDRIGLRRLARCQEATGPLLLYLPGMHMNAELPLTDPRHDLRVYLAGRGVRTWGLDYRSHAVPPDASPDDLATLAAWTAEVFLEDAAWASAFVRSAERGPLYVAGFSYGAALAYRLATVGPQRPAGLLVLDGAHDRQGRRGRGDAAIDVGGRRLPFDRRQELLTEVVADPEGPSPVPGAPTAGSALAEILYTAPGFGGRGGLANARDGTSDVRVVAALLLTYDRWWPRAALAAPPPRPPTTPLPVLAFASTNLGRSWVERVGASARAFGGRSAVVHVLEGYGHLDVLVGRQAVRDVYVPTLAWLGRPRGR